MTLEEPEFRFQPVGELCGCTQKYSANTKAKIPGRWAFLSIRGNSPSIVTRSALFNATAMKECSES